MTHFVLDGSICWGFGCVLLAFLVARKCHCWAGFRETQITNCPFLEISMGRKRVPPETSINIESIAAPLCLQVFCLHLLVDTRISVRGNPCSVSIAKGVGGGQSSTWQALRDVRSLFQLWLEKLPSWLRRHCWDPAYDLRLHSNLLRLRSKFAASEGLTRGAQLRGAGLGCTRLALVRNLLLALMYVETETTEIPKAPRPCRCK